MSDDGAPEELEDVDSGPFCQHFNDPADCDVRCATCRHYCCLHTRFEPHICYEATCECAGFANPPEDLTP